MLHIRTHRVTVRACPALTQSQSSCHNQMLKLPPPIWTLIYVLTAAAISWFFNWSKVPGLPLASLGISLVAFVDSTRLGHCALSAARAPRSNLLHQSIASLLRAGPYQFTRNPMYLGLVLLTLGIAIWVGAWPMFGAPLALFATANWVHIPL